MNLMPDSGSWEISTGLREDIALWTKLAGRNELRVKIINELSSTHVAVNRWAEKCTGYEPVLFKIAVGFRVWTGRIVWGHNLSFLRIHCPVA